MSRNSTPIRDRVREMAKELNMESGRTTLAGRVKALTEKALNGWGALAPQPTRNGMLGLESFDGPVPTRNASFDVNRDGDPRSLMTGLKDLGMAPRHIEQVAEQCLSLFDGAYDASAILRGNGNVSDTYAPMSRVVGRTAASNLARLGENIGLEAFGDDINRLNTDDRLTMDLIIMRPWDNIMDKALARVSESSPVVTIRVPSPEAYDWAVTQAPNSTSASRNQQNTYKLRDLYRNPTPVNSASKPIKPIIANDSGSVLSALGDGKTYYKTGVAVSLLDLSRTASGFGYATVDRTDLVADGGHISAVIVTVTATVGSTPHTEKFLINTRSFDMSLFVISPNNKASGQRQVMMQASLPITVGTTQYDGTASLIAAALTDATLVADVQVNSSLNIQTGQLQASGTVNLTLLPLTTGATISGTTNTMFGTTTAGFTDYGVALDFDEENQRKANLAVWVQYYEQQFVVPRSRIYFTEYSLTQDIDENAVAATSSIVALGNGRRGLDIVVNALNDVAVGLQFASNNPLIANFNTIDEQSFASSLVKPTVVTTTLDYATEELNTMNESTRLSEIHGRFRARFLSMVTIMFAKSLMLNQYKAGEVPVIKAWTHSSIADLVIGILDYHPDLKDKESIATGADYSMVLPNGYRLDVIKSNLDCLQQRIYAVPVIESEMSSVLSAASIRDCGTVTTNYTPTNAGSVVRRVATTTREIVMMSNRVGISMVVTGLEAQLGVYGYAPVNLNVDFSESLAV